MHGLIFETSICYWQDQPGSFFVYRSESNTFDLRLSAITKHTKIAGLFRDPLFLGVVYIYSRTDVPKKIEN